VTIVPKIELSFHCNVCETDYGRIQVDPYDQGLNRKIFGAYLAHVATAEHLVPNRVQGKPNTSEGKKRMKKPSQAASKRNKTK
jgi:hypothetical protein